MKVKKPAPVEEKKAPGEDPMAEMLARIKSGNVHLRRIEAATSVGQQLLQQSINFLLINRKRRSLRMI